MTPERMTKVIKVWHALFFYASAGLVLWMLARGMGL
jgi:hypothetical protein